jgi:ABC-type glycerol-3-phosphate transport system substrate-binding protein
MLRLIILSLASLFIVNCGGSTGSSDSEVSVEDESKDVTLMTTTATSISI